MGNSRFDTTAYAAYSTASTTRFDPVTKRVFDKSISDTFVNRRIDPSLDPRDISLRESCDSDANPLSRPIIIGLDVTGSMGQIAFQFAQKSIGNLMGKIYEQRPVSDPHLMFMGIGDAWCDSAPLQVSQFEADIRIAEQLLKLYVEGGGGGNNSESYTLPWFFASRYCKIDSFAKRGKKGFIFTIGDECAPEPLLKRQIENIMGTRPEFSEITELTGEQLYNEASKEWEIFHVLVEQGDYCRHSKTRAVKSWYNLIGNRLLRLDNKNNLEEIILAAIRIAEGMSPEEVLEKADPAARSSIKHALFDAGEYSKPVAA